MAGRMLLLVGALAAVVVPVRASMLNGQTIQTTYLYPTQGTTFVHQ